MYLERLPSIEGRRRTLPPLADEEMVGPSRSKAKPSKSSKGKEDDGDEDDDDEADDDSDDGEGGGGGKRKRERPAPSKRRSSTGAGGGNSSNNAFTRPYKLSSQLAQLTGVPEVRAGGRAGAEVRAGAGGRGRGMHSEGGAGWMGVGSTPSVALPLGPQFFPQFRKTVPP